MTRTEIFSCKQPGNREKRCQSVSSAAICESSGLKPCYGEPKPRCWRKKPPQFPKEIVFWHSGRKRKPQLGEVILVTSSAPLVGQTRCDRGETSTSLFLTISGKTLTSNKQRRLKWRLGRRQLLVKKELLEKGPKKKVDEDQRVSRGLGGQGRRVILVLTRNSHFLLVENACRGSSLTC